MAKIWHRNGNPDDLAWWTSPDEAQLILCALRLVERHSSKAEPWRLGVEEHFVERGTAITDHAIQEINRHLFRFGRGREIELVDNGLDSRHLSAAEAAEIRRSTLAELRQITSDAELLTRFDAMLRKVDAAAPAVIRFRQPEPQPIQAEPAWRPVLVATGINALKTAVAPSIKAKPEPEVVAAFDYIPHERPAFDRATIQHLIAVAPDTATEAWLRGFLRA